MIHAIHSNHAAIHTAIDGLPAFRTHITIRGNDMIRLLAVLLPILLLGCADQSKGAALNECRMGYIWEARPLRLIRSRTA